VAGDGSDGRPGVAPGASIVSVKVLDDCSFAGCFYAFSEIVAALDHLVVHQGTLGVRAVNMSLGTSALYSGVCDQTTAANIAASQAVHTLWQMGVVVFASSMNNGSSTHMASPACLERVVSVGAVDGNDAVASFSNSNALTDLLAPGVGILSLGMGSGWRAASGTSMSAPHAAGCAALLAHASPGITAEELLARLRRSAVQVTDARNGITLPRIDCAPGGHAPDPRGHAPVERP
jgi:subtilisin family serine protease